MFPYNMRFCTIYHYVLLVDKYNLLVVQYISEPFVHTKLKYIGGDFLNNLRVLRKERNISIVQLARYVEISEGYVAMIERGERTPSKAVAKKFAEMLNLPLEVIFSEFECTSGS